MPYYKTTLNNKYSICFTTETPEEIEKVMMLEFNFKEMEFHTKEITEEEYKLLIE